MPSSLSTKMPKSAMLRTMPFTTVPGGYFSLSDANGLGSSCFMPRLMRFWRGSMSSTSAPHCASDRVPLGRWLSPPGPGHLRDVDQALDALLQLDEGAVVLERD